MSLEHAHEFFARSLERAEVLYAQVQNRMRCASVPHETKFRLVEALSGVCTTRFILTASANPCALDESLSLLNSFAAASNIRACHVGKCRGRRVAHCPTWQLVLRTRSPATGREQVAAQGMLGKESSLDALQVGQDPYISVINRASDITGMSPHLICERDDPLQHLVLRSGTEARLCRRWLSPSLACLFGCIGPHCALSWEIRCGHLVRPLMCIMSCDTCARDCCIRASFCPDHKRVA